jgi:predicted ATPase/class 3 adenylate cyclase
MTVADVPRGTVTFLFTEIEGSTALWEQDRAAMAVAVARQFALIDEAVRANHGRLYKRVGDAAQAAFPSAGDAVSAAVAAQCALAAESWTLPAPIRVGMALHSGEAAPDASGDFNQVPALNRLSRLLAVAHGGQIVLTQTTRGVAEQHLPEGIALRDLGEHRLRDLLQPERVWQVIAPGLADDFPAIRTADHPPTNLPPQPTPLIGREEEVAHIRALIEEEQTQLVTLTGPGGTGKTRLALAVAASLLDDFPAGVWFVDLAPLRDPAQVEATIAGTLGVREAPGRSLRDALVDFLASRRLLLLLDNFEHLLPVTPLVGDLLRSGSRLVILATSREPLRLRGEQEVAIAPLPLADPDHLPALDALAENPAVALFVARAKATKADFALTAGNAATIAAICQRLDGLPLAIELAAARVKLLPPQSLLSRLEQSLPILTGGPRDAPTRQRTLRDAIAWSYDLLDDEEKAFFRRLGAFVGGFTFEAAEWVSGVGWQVSEDDSDARHPTSDTLNLLTSIVEKSLLRSVDGDGGEARFTLLETIREFAVEQLRASGETERVRDSQASWFLRAATEWRGQVWGARQRFVQECVAREAGNFRAALDWLLDRGDVERAAKLIIGLVDFWYLRSQLQEATEWLERVHARIQDLPLSLAGAISSRLATFLQPQEELARAEALAERAVLIQRELRGGPDFDAQEYAFALFVWSASLEEPARRVEELEEALAQFRALGDQAWTGHVLSNLGIAAFIAGDAEQALAYSEEAVAVHQEAQNEWGLALAKIDLGEILRLSGEPAAAMPHFQEALRGAQASQDLWRMANGLQCIAAILASGKRARTAARLFGAAAQLRARYGAIRESEVEDYEPEIASEIRGAIGRDAFVAEFAAGRETPLDEIVEAALAVPVEEPGVVSGVRLQGRRLRRPRLDQTRDEACNVVDKHERTRWIDPGDACLAPTL